MILFKVLWAINAIVAIVIFYFFLTGLSDGTVNGRNAGLWLLLVAFLAAILGGSIWLRSARYPGFAVALLCILALPALLSVVYFGIAIGTNSRWN